MITASIGQTVTVELPYSEVNMHMRVAGKRMQVRVQTNGAQLLNVDGTPFSFPITHSEAGIHVNPCRSCSQCGRCYGCSAHTQCGC